MIKRFLADVNSTNAVVFAGIIMAFATMTRYLLAGVHFDLQFGKFGFTAWEPSGEWLLFVTGFATIATAHFGLKRHSDREYQAAKQGTTIKAQTADVRADEVNIVEENANGT